MYYRCQWEELFDSIDGYEFSMKENPKIAYIKRKYPHGSFIIATVDLVEDQIKVHVGDNYYIIKTDINPDIIQLIIQLYEDYIEAKHNLDKSISKFWKLRDGDKSLLRDFRLDELI
jgi:hypothetical protein